MTLYQHEFVKALKPKAHQDLKLDEKKNLSLVGALAKLPLTRFGVGIYVAALHRFNHRHQVAHVRRANVVVRWNERNAVDLVYSYFDKADNIVLGFSDAAFKKEEDEATAMRCCVVARRIFVRTP